MSIVSIKITANRAETRVEKPMLVVKIHIDAIVRLFNSSENLIKLYFDIVDFNMSLMMHIRKFSMHRMKRTRRSREKLLNLGNYRHFGS